jgi:hypothetical protein
MTGAGGCPSVLVAAALLLAAGANGARAEPEQVNTIKEVILRLQGCWKPPAPSLANPMDITVLVSFNRADEIMGRPRITYESTSATDNDRLVYRIAVMEALKRCSPMPFTEGMAGAAAGHPFWIEFRNQRPSPQP